MVSSKARTQELRQSMSPGSSSSPLKPDPRPARANRSQPPPGKEKRMLVMQNTRIKGRASSTQGAGSDVKRIGKHLAAKAPPPHKLKVVRANLKSRKSDFNSSLRHGSELSRFEESEGSYAAKRKPSRSSRSKRGASA